MLLTPSAPLTKITSVRRQRWLQKKLSISDSGRNFVHAPIPLFLSYLSRSQNPLLAENRADICPLPRNSGPLCYSCVQPGL